MENNDQNPLELWNRVCETDPNFTKEARKGAYKFTCIAPMYQFKKATEVFGPQGIGWGVEPDSEAFAESKYADTVILSYDAILFYKFDGQIGRISIHATEKVCYITDAGKGYLKIDDEVRKKVVTNAKTKGLSELGFSADVFMGMFDDPNYVDYRRTEAYIDNAEDQEKALRELREDLLKWLKNEIGVYAQINTVQAMQSVYATHKKRLEAKCKLAREHPAKYVKRLDKAYFDREAQLKNKEQAS